MNKTMTRRLTRFFIPRPTHSHQSKRSQFIVAWMRSPMKIGAILPSSRALARAMASQIDIRDGGAVIELGAGTGMVTHALIGTGIALDQLLVIEREKDMFTILQQQFPQLSPVLADALQLDKVIQEHGVKDVHCIVSSLPLLSMPRTIRYAIEGQMVAAITDGGHIVQFTYGSSSPISRERWTHYGIFGIRKKAVFANMPPAYVWVFRKDKRKKPR
jgi:phosphatidylethanolamine/phosphatidyl-N-methylethanolamine N-methyltransferase